MGGSRANFGGFQPFLQLARPCDFAHAERKPFLRLVDLAECRNGCFPAREGEGTSASEKAGNPRSWPMERLFQASRSGKGWKPPKMAPDELRLVEANVPNRLEIPLKGSGSRNVLRCAPSAVSLRALGGRAHVSPPFFLSAHPTFTEWLSLFFLEPIEPAYFSGTQDGSFLTISPIGTVQPSFAHSAFGQAGTRILGKQTENMASSSRKAYNLHYWRTWTFRAVLGYLNWGCSEVHQHERAYNTTFGL